MSDKSEGKGIRKIKGGTRRQKGGKRHNESEEEKREKDVATCRQMALRAAS